MRTLESEVPWSVGDCNGIVLYPTVSIDPEETTIKSIDQEETTIKKALTEKRPPSKTALTVILFSNRFGI